MTELQNAHRATKRNKTKSMGTKNAPIKQQSEASIDEALEESFPASDPPAWTSSGSTQKKSEDH